MEPDRDKFVPVFRNVEPAFTLYSTGRYALEKAQRTEESSFLELLTANLMAALAFEAFLNTAGQFLWGTGSEVWAAVERLSPIAKLKAIAEQCGFDIDLSRRPAQTMIDVYGFRNEVAHGKPQLLEAKVPRGAVGVGLPFPKTEGVTTKWEQQCTVEFAERALDDLQNLTDELSELIGFLNPLDTEGMRGWSR
jgi:hypothetical protein